MKRTIQLIIAFGALLALPLNGASQSGEQLFKQCNTCHTLGKKSTGPDLLGVRAKWQEAGEGDLLYQWVKNPSALIAAGNSTMANAIKDFSPTTMDAQQVSDADIDAIFDYIDSWTPPPPPPPPAGEVEVTYVPDYAQNLTLFYWLCGGIILQLFAIIVVSGSITTLIRSDYFKEKLSKMNKEQTTKIVATILVLGATLTGTSTYAFTFNGPGAADAGQPWLLIENIDLTVLLIINFILLGVLFYLKRMFNQFIGMVRTKKETVAVETTASKLNKALTDVVPIEEEHTILLHHEYDGIKELDNNLPPWWVWMFYATIAFGIVYTFHYHILGTGDLQVAEFENDMAAKQAQVNEYLANQAFRVDETTVELLTDDASISAGKQIFIDNCATCHNENASGKSGPNLTDDHWIYGYDIKDLFSTVKYGTQGGMPEHNDKLTGQQIQKVTSFVLSLPFTEGQPPQGDIIEEKAE